MGKETDMIRQSVSHEQSLDAIDRRLLGVLVEDATVSYAELGKQVALSAPAAHERVKRMRRSGAIRKTVVLISPQAIEKSLLAFVHIDTKGWGNSPDMMAISTYPEVEEIHSVAGDTSMLLKIRTKDTLTLERLISHLYQIPGVEATRTYIVLSTYMERPVQPESTKV
jgi:DNA-binding Lrp family transcriptional regulator